MSVDGFVFMPVNKALSRDQFGNVSHSLWPDNAGDCVMTFNITRILSVLALIVNFPVAAGDLSAAYVDATWDGKTVPDGHQCQKFGGGADSPAIRVSAIPAGSNAIVLEFSDRNYTPMDHGGHGKVGFEIAADTTETTVPPAPAHSFDLPPGFWVVQAHGAPSWDTPGAYLPPCSGGKGNAYYVTVKAVRRHGEQLEVLGETVLEMGTY